MPEASSTADSSQETRGKPAGSKARRWITGIVAVLVLTVACWFLLIEVALWRGAANIESRNHTAALTWLQTAGAVGADRAELDYLKARCYRRLGELKKVEHHLTRARDAGWDMKQLEREQWLALAQSNQWGQMSDHWADLFEHAGSDGPEISQAYTPCVWRGFNSPKLTKC